MEMGWPSVWLINFCGTCIMVLVSSNHLFVSGMDLFIFYVLTFDNGTALNPLQVVFDEFWMKMGWPGPWVPNFCDSWMACPVSSCYLLGSGVVSLFFYILILDIELILTCLQVVFDEYWMKMGWPGPWVPNFCDSWMACPVSSSHLFASGIDLFIFYILALDIVLILNPLQVDFQEYLMKMWFRWIMIEKILNTCQCTPFCAKSDWSPDA